MIDQDKLPNFYDGGGGRIMSKWGGEVCTVNPARWPAEDFATVMVTVLCALNDRPSIPKPLMLSHRNPPGMTPQI
jgi:hypothetical protein